MNVHFDTASYFIKDIVKALKIMTFNAFILLIVN